jgi:hypothetical protein
MVVSALLGGLAMLIIVAPVAVAMFLVLGPVAFGYFLLPLSTVVSTPIKAATSCCFYRDAFRSSLTEPLSNGSAQAE